LGSAAIELGEDIPPNGEVESTVRAPEEIV
jgi:hypothetical protein